MQHDHLLNNHFQRENGLPPFVHKTDKDAIMNVIKCGTQRGSYAQYQVILSLINSLTFIHFNTASLSCLAALNVVKTHYKGLFVLQIHNTTVSIKYTCDTISKLLYTMKFFLYL